MLLRLIVLKTGDPYLSLRDQLGEFMRVIDLAIQISENVSPLEQIARTRFDLSEAPQFTCPCGSY